MRNAEMIDSYSHAHVYKRYCSHQCMPWSDKSDVEMKHITRTRTNLPVNYISLLYVRMSFCSDYIVILW